MALGAATGLWLYRTLLPDAVAVIYASGGILLALVQYGGSRVDDHLKGAIDVLRSVPSPQTDRLRNYAIRKRRRQTQARVLAAALSIGAVAAAAFLQTDALKAEQPAAINATIAAVIAAVGGSFLAVQLVATGIALRMWLDAEEFEEHAHELAERERDRMAFQRELAKQPPPAVIRPLAEGVPVKYAGTP